MARTALPRVLGVAFAILLSAAAARAQSVHEVVPGGDSITGTIVADGEVDRIPIRLVEGAVFSVSLKAAKKSTLLPTLVLLGPDRQPDPTLATYLKVNSKGNVLAVKNMPITETGLRWLEVRGKSPTTGGWVLTTKIKLPKGTAGSPAINKVQGTTSFPFPVPGNALATIVVAAAKGSPANPVFGGLTDPVAANVPVDEVVPGKTGFSIKNVVLAKPGTYTLVLQPGTGGDGAVTVTLKWKIPKPFKRALLESQVITDPVLTGITPPSGNTAQTVAVVVTVDFARPGAKVSFRKPPTVVTAQGSGLTIGPASISFNQSLASFQKGDYDVEVENPDGGKASLVKAFTVVNAPATLTGISPIFGYDSQSAVQVTATGSFINGGATATLVRGLESIAGTSVLATSNSITATYDLRGHAIGFFDMVVINPDAAATSLDDAFEIRNSPPLVASITPANNTLSAVVNCTIDGTDFDATPTVSLGKTGQADIPGTSVVWVNGTRLTCTFDTTGKAIGSWDLRVVNPVDGLSSTLPGGFRISGTVAPAAMILSAGNTSDGPPAICWNGTRNEFLLGWVEETSGNYYAWIQRLDPAGSPLGSKVGVSSSSSTVLKQDIFVGWDSTNDQYLVCWCEPRTTPTSVTSVHPSSGYTSLSQVFLQRYLGSDLSTLGTNTQVTAHNALTVSPSFYMDEFNNYRPDCCWDAKNARWQIVWMQEWSSRNVNAYGYDDWDVLQQTLDPATGGLLANPVGVSTQPYHEGDPCIVYDPVNQSVIVAWNTRTTITAALDGCISSVANVVTQDTIDTQDMRLAVDPDGGRLIATWTKSPASGSKYVEGATFSLPSVATKVGATVAIGSGSGDHFFARPMYNPALKEALIAWTRKDASAGLTVRSTRATTGTSSGLVLFGGEKETSSGSTDEAIPVTVYSGTAGESVVLWLKTMSFVSVNAYAGSAFSGIYRGKEFWLVRYR